MREQRRWRSVPGPHSCGTAPRAGGGCPVLLDSPLMSTSTLPRTAAVSLLFLACSLACGSVQAHAINGAIYTSASNGQVVNQNSYPFKSWVYLNGGPSNASCS